MRIVCHAAACKMKRMILNRAYEEDIEVVGEAEAALVEMSEAVTTLHNIKNMGFKMALRAYEEDIEVVGEAEAALVELEEAEAEEREVEEAEDLLEYYLQRAATTQSEAERLLAGARDLEESIGVSLSARRFEVPALFRVV